MVREIPTSKSCREALLTFATKARGRVESLALGELLNDPRIWFELPIAEANIPNFTWHDVTHRFYSRLIVAGVDLKTPQTLMGHKTISMTARYAHLSSAHLDSAVDKLEAGAGFGVTALEGTGPSLVYEASGFG